MRFAVAALMLVGGVALAQQSVIIQEPGPVPPGYCDPDWPKLPGYEAYCAKQAQQPEPPKPKPKAPPPQERQRKRIVV